MNERFVLATAIGGLLAGCHPEVSRKVDVAAEIEAIERFTQEWADAYNHGDLKQVLDGFSSDGVILEDGQPPITGTENLETFWRENLAMAKGATLVLKPTRTKVSADGLLGYSMGNMRLTVPGDSGPVTVADLKYLDTLVKEDGEWKWEIGIANSNTPASKAAGE